MADTEYDQMVADYENAIGLNDNPIPEEVSQEINGAAIEPENEISKTEEILQALEKQQETVPENERGLANKIQELQERIKADPAMAEDPTTKTELAWLLEDWEKFSGTNQRPAISAWDWSNLKLDYGEGQYPGLVNQELQSLLNKTPEIQNQEVIARIRERVVETAHKSPEEQEGPDVQALANQMALYVEDLLSRRPEMTDAVETDSYTPNLNGTNYDGPLEHFDEGSSPSDYGEEVAVSGTSQENAAQDLLTEQGGFDNDSEIAPVPPGDEDRNRPSETEMSNEDVNKNQETLPPGTEQEQENQVRSEDVARSQNAQGRNPAEPANRLNNASRAQNVIGRGTMAPSKVAGLGASFGNFLGNARAKFEENTSSAREENDRKRIEKRVADLNKKIEVVDSDFLNLKIKGKVFFDAFDQNIKSSGLSPSKVISEMRPGGRFEDLRGVLNTELSKSGPFAEAWNKLEKSSKALAIATDFVSDEARQRNMSNNPELKKAERSVGRIALSLEKLPGREAGENFLKEIGEALQRIADKFREFFGRARQTEQKRSEAPAPGM